MKTDHFHNKVVIITGSAQGIGKRTAEMLAKRGAKVVINSRKQEKVTSVVETINNGGGNAIGLVSYLVDELKIHLYEVCSGLNTTTDRGKAAIWDSLFSAYKENLERKEIIIPNMAAYLKKGNWFSRAPRGYDHFGPKVRNIKFHSPVQKIVINEEGKILREAWGWKMTGLYSDVQIAEKLLARGFEIHHKRLSELWRNPFYCGILISSLLKDGNAIKGNWEPLISQSDFWKLQDILNVRASGYQHKKVADYKPLNRLVKCNDCGTYLVGYLVKKKNLGYYKCPDCNGVSMNCETTPKAKRVGAHDLFTTLLEKYQVQPQFKNLLITQLTRIYGYLNNTEIKKGIDCKKILDELKKKLNDVLPYFMSNLEFIEFIESNSDSDVFVTSIHKSKGREFPRCVVVNSSDPEMLIKYGSMTHDLSEYSFITDDGDVDEEGRNIHYVAVTRPKEELYFMIFDEI